MASDEVVRSRVQGLFAQPIDDEVVVYDPETEAAHVLSPLAATIWHRAQSGATISELSEITPEGGEAAVRLALVDLESAGLLDESPTSAEIRGMSRRALLKRLGIAAIAVPFVTTIATANPAAAAVGALCGGSQPACPSTEQCINGRCYRTCQNANDCSGGTANPCTGCCCTTITGSTGKVCNNGGTFCT